MKNILKPIMATLTLLSLHSKSYSQEAESIFENKKVYYEQGLNITQFIKQYASFNNSSVNGLPYLVTGNIGFKKFGIRYGANYIIDNESTVTPSDPTSTNNTSVDEKNKLNNGNFRLGFYHSKNIAKRWRLLYGLDYTMTLRKEVTSRHNVTSNSSSFSSFTSETTSNSTSKTMLMGGGPFLSIQFFINRSFSIGTEASYYYIFGESKDNSNSTTVNTNISFGNVDVTSTTSNFNTTQKISNAQTFIPSSLFINFRF